MLLLGAMTGVVAGCALRLADADRFAFPGRPGEVVGFVTGTSAAWWASTYPAGAPGVGELALGGGFGYALGGAIAGIVEAVLADRSDEGPVGVGGGGVTTTSPGPEPEGPPSAGPEPAPVITGAPDRPEPLVLTGRWTQ